MSAVLLDVSTRSHTNDGKFFSKFFFFFLLSLVPSGIIYLTGRNAPKVGAPWHKTLDISFASEGSWHALPFMLIARTFSAQLPCKNFWPPSTGSSSRDRDVYVCCLHPSVAWFVSTRQRPLKLVSKRERERGL